MSTTVPETDLDAIEQDLERGADSHSVAGAIELLFDINHCLTARLNHPGFITTAFAGAHLTSIVNPAGYPAARLDWNALANAVVTGELGPFGTYVLEAFHTAMDEG